LDARLPWAINGRYNASRRLDPTSPNGLRLKLKLYVIDSIDTCGKVVARERRDSGDAGGPGYHIAELMLTERPSIAKRYWSLLEEIENCHGTAYQEKEFAFANALLLTMEGDDAPSTACSFADICQEHCQSIQSYLEEHNWLGGWSSGDSKHNISFRQRVANSIQGAEILHHCQRLLVSQPFPYTAYWLSSLIIDSIGHQSSRE
jgi:hypothetical protein